MEQLQKYRVSVLILSLLLVMETAWLGYFWSQRPKRRVVPVPVPVALKGKIAIVIDDWGYNTDNLYILEHIRYPLTLSVLPNLTYSRRVAEQGHRLGLEIILHLPMEPYEKYRLEQNTVMTSMSESTILDILNEDLRSIVYAKGVSNHMGSRATRDSRTMAIIFNALKKRNLYFLDSFVSNEHTCADLARKTQVPFARRDVFLDNRKEPEYIKSQINKLKNRAKVYGQAIGIGHDREVTLKVLRDVLPEMEKEGFRLVFVSDLVR